MHTKTRLKKYIIIIQKSSCETEFHHFLNQVEELEFCEGY